MADRIRAKSLTLLRLHCEALANPCMHDSIFVQIHSRAQNNCSIFTFTLQIVLVISCNLTPSAMKQFPPHKPGALSVTVFIYWASSVILQEEYPKKILFYL